jgi:hypothetical protein
MRKKLTEEMRRTLAEGITRPPTEEMIRTLTEGIRITLAWENTG